jgi:exonuclease VII small subunit
MNALAVSSRQIYEESRQEFDKVVGHLDSEEARLKIHSELERELEKMGRELMRKLLQEHPESRGPGQCAQPVKSKTAWR